MPTAIARPPRVVPAAAAAPGAVPHVTDIPPVVGAALLGLDYLGAAPDAERRLRSAARTGIQPGE